MTQPREAGQEREQNWRLQIAYLGTQFHGWQHQDGLRTVQGTIQDAVSKLAQQQIHVQGAGRTDSQVHAAGQVAHCSFSTRLTGQKLLLALNHFLPDDVSVVDVKEADSSFHAKKDSIGKRYVYRFLCRPAPHPFLHHRTWHQRGGLNLEAMKSAAQHFVGHHNFDGFRSSLCSAAHANRYIWKSELGAPDDSGVMLYEVRGNAFCQHMVRIMAGTLLEIGRERFTPDEVPEMLEARDRTRSGMTAPGKGLTLEEVYYPDDLTTAEIPEGANFPGYPPAPQD